MVTLNGPLKGSIYPATTMVSEQSCLKRKFPKTICLSLQTRHSCTENYEASLRGRHKADADILSIATHNGLEMEHISKKLKNYSVSFSCLELVLSPTHTKMFSQCYSCTAYHLHLEGRVVKCFTKASPQFPLSLQQSLFRGHKGLTKENIKLRGASFCSFILFYLPTWFPWWLRWSRICLQCRRPGQNILWKREWLPIAVLLPEFHGQEPGGLQSMGRKRVKHN